MFVVDANLLGHRVRRKKRGRHKDYRKKITHVFTLLLGCFARLDSRYRVKIFFSLGRYRPDACRKRFANRAGHRCLGFRAVYLMYVRLRKIKRSKVEFAMIVLQPLLDIFLILLLQPFSQNGVRTAYSGHHRLRQIEFLYQVNKIIGLLFRCGVTVQNHSVGKIQRAEFGLHELVLMPGPRAYSMPWLRVAGTFNGVVMVLVDQIVRRHERHATFLLQDSRLGGFACARRSDEYDQSGRSPEDGCGTRLIQKVRSAMDRPGAATGSLTLCRALHCSCGSASPHTPGSLSNHMLVITLWPRGSSTHFPDASAPAVQLGGGIDARPADLDLNFFDPAGCF